MSQSHADDFFDAVLRGDSHWMLNNFNTVKDDDFCSMQTLISSLPGSKRISSKDLCRLYNHITAKQLSVVACGKLAAGYGLKSKLIREGDFVCSGYETAWQKFEK